MLKYKIKNLISCIKKNFLCKHERLTKFYPKDATWENTVSGSNGLHKTIIVEGCLNCHKMWIRDYGE